MSPVPVALALPNEGHLLACVLVAAGPSLEEQIPQQRGQEGGCPGSHRSAGDCSVVWGYFMVPSGFRGV